MTISLPTRMQAKFTYVCIVIQYVKKNNYCKFSYLKQNKCKNAYHITLIKNNKQFKILINFYYLKY